MKKVRKAGSDLISRVPRVSNSHIYVLKMKDFFLKNLFSEVNLTRRTFSFAD